MRLVDAYRYVRGVSRGVRRGDTFPAAARVPARPAPGGSRSVWVGRGRVESDRFELSEHVVAVPGLERPVEVLHLTDVHLRGPGPWVDRLCEVVSRQRPDLVALTGDVVTRGFQVAVADQFLSALPAAPLGRFAVIGNWEVWGGAPKGVWEAHLARHGIPLLHDRWVDTGPLQVVGTDDFLSGRPDVDAAFAGTTDKPTLVLTHSPALFPRLARAPSRVVLAGHTHAGQVRMPFAGALFLPRGSSQWVHGWYEQDGVHLFVSRGIGWSIAPVRWRCPPELALIRLVPG